MCSPGGRRCYLPFVDNYAVTINVILTVLPVEVDEGRHTFQALDYTRQASSMLDHSFI
jgi:hypothetical protein